MVRYGKQRVSSKKSPCIQSKFMTVKRSCFIHLTGVGKTWLSLAIAMIVAGRGKLDC